MHHPVLIWSVCFLWLLSFLFVCAALSLFFCFEDILYMSRTDSVAAMMLLSGIVMVPSNFYILNTISRDEELEHKNKFLCCSLRACTIWIIIVNTVGCFMCVQRIYLCDSTTHLSIKTGMSQYKNNPNLKRFIDNLQWTLKCCGADSYRDWFNQEWHDKLRDYEWLPSRDKKTIVNLTQADSVPLSCCKSGSCMANYLLELGTNSIHTRGCNGFVSSTIKKYLWLALFTFLLVIILEILILKYTNSSTEDSKPQKTRRLFKVLNIMSRNEKFKYSSGSGLVDPADNEAGLASYQDD